jgi:KaiC/GvpD/RAD55 family RecA-like ATPase
VVDDIQTTMTDDDEQVLKSWTRDDLENVVRVLKFDYDEQGKKIQQQKLDIDRLRRKADRPEEPSGDWMEDAEKNGKPQEPSRLDGYEDLDILYETVEGVFPMQGTAFLSGPSQAGKTALALDLASRLVRGVDWAGKKIPHAVGIAYFAYEGESSIKPRWKAICETVGDDLRSVPFYSFHEDPKTLNTEEGWASLYVTVKECARRCRNDFGIELSVVCIDTVTASLMVPDEDKSKDWAPIISKIKRMAARLGVVMLFVHHPAKGENGSIMRGSGTSYNGADTIIASAIEKHEGAVSRRWLYLEKTRNGETGYLTDYSMHPVIVGMKASGDEWTAPVIKYDLEGEKRLAEEKAKPKEKRLTDPETRVMRAIAKAAHKWEERPKQLSSGKWYYAAAMSAVEDEARKQIAAKNFKRDFEDGINRLLTRDWLEIDDVKMRYLLTSIDKVPVNLLPSSNSSSTEDSS